MRAFPLNENRFIFGADIDFAPVVVKLPLPRAIAVPREFFWENLGNFLDLAGRVGRGLHGFVELEGGCARKWCVGGFLFPLPVGAPQSLSPLLLGEG